jgi:hypothetical protein
MRHRSGEIGQAHRRASPNREAPAEKLPVIFGSVSRLAKRIVFKKGKTEEKGKNRRKIEFTKLSIHCL